MATARVSQQFTVGIDSGLPAVRMSQQFVSAIDAGDPHVRASQWFLVVIEDSGEGVVPVPPAIINNPLVLT